jgi:CubicO group peptidase (beta-lactamase class C family)
VHELNRRDFLGMVGAGAAALTTTATPPVGSAVLHPGKGGRAQSPAALARVQQVLDETRQKYGTSGGALAILDGDEIHEFVTGVRDIRSREPITKETIFYIGSTTKTWNATLVMQLVDEGRIDLDVPVKRYLPELRLADQQALDTLTMRHLLSMSSGIDNGPYLYLQRSDAVEWYVNGLAEIPQIHAPGAMYGYSNAGSTVAGRVVEALTGMDWDTAITQRLLKPLGLRQSAALPSDVEEHPTVTSHEIGLDGKAIRVASWYDRAHGPAGSSLRQSAGDLMRFGAFHLGGGSRSGGRQLLRPATVARMQQAETHPPKGFLADGWGLGWMLYERGGHSVCGHAGGHLGQGSDFWFLPGRARAGGAAMVSNCGFRPFYADVLQWVFQELFDVDFSGTSTLWVTDTLPAPRALDLTPYTGVFERYGQRSEVTIENGALVLTNTTNTQGLRPMLAVLRYTLRPIDQAVFAIEQPFGGVYPLCAFTGFADGRPGQFFDGPYTPFLARRTDAPSPVA